MNHFFNLGRDDLASLFIGKGAQVNVQNETLLIMLATSKGKPTNSCVRYYKK